MCGGECPYCTAVGYGRCVVADRQVLQLVVKTAQNSYISRCRKNTLIISGTLPFPLMHCLSLSFQVTASELEPPGYGTAFFLMLWEWYILKNHELLLLYTSVGIFRALLQIEMDNIAFYGCILWLLITAIIVYVCLCMFTYLFNFLYLFVLTLLLFTETRGHYFFLFMYDMFLEWQ